jgi:hypothetical protein
LPVWVSTWEFECCQPDAAVGEPWTAYLFLREGDPWWIEYATTPVADNVLAFGRVAFDGVVLRPASGPNGAALVAHGPVRLAVPGTTDATSTRFEGVIEHEGHGGGDADGIGDYDVECTGIVRAVHGIAHQYEPRLLDEGEGMVPVGQAPPIACESTRDRAFDTYVVTIEFGPGAAATEQ